ncbi:MAG TPA: DUF6252 family protein [Flavobacterium sp.]|jgi:hypothetical protein
MKKIISLLILIVTFSSCSEDISRNSPALEGIKDGVRWRAAGITATKTANGRLTITGVRQLETLVLKVNSMSEFEYELGLTQLRMASFTSTNGFGETTWSTGDTNMAHGDGVIEITEYDEENQTVSGTFRFNAVNQEEGAEEDVINWQSGIFYKVPLIPAE